MRQAIAGIAREILAMMGVAQCIVLADAKKVFAGPLVLFEDQRSDYGEQRVIGIGSLGALVALIVHVESDATIHVISMRKADNHETNLFYQSAGYF